FLDHHILHGNSLLGATPAAIERGIPNEAFVALTDDDKQWVKSLRNRNRQERTGQRRLGLGDSTIARVPDEILGLDGSHDSTIEAIHAKEAAMASWKESPAYRHALLVADAWCSAFFLEKKPDVPVLTEDAYRRLCDEGAIEPALEAEIQRIA